MCGINGLWSDFGTKDEHRISIKKMNDALYHRGPDNLEFGMILKKILFRSYKIINIRFKSFGFSTYDKSQ